MSNMSYCRFENTDRDLGDCENALEYFRDGEESPLSSYELEAAKRLAKRCQAIIKQLSNSAREMNLVTDSDEIDALNFDFDQVIDQYQEGAEMMKATFNED